MLNKRFNHASRDIFFVLNFFAQSHHLAVGCWATWALTGLSLAIRQEIYKVGGVFGVSIPNTYFITARRENIFTTMEVDHWLSAWGLFQGAIFVFKQVLEDFAKDVTKDWAKDFGKEALKHVCWKRCLDQSNWSSGEGISRAI